MKGIILAGGTGSRLYPTTKAQSKALLPVYNKPMIYYPISVLMLSKIKDILIITTSEYIETYRRLLGDGSNLGIRLSYDIQKEPKGIADAFIIAEEFLDGGAACLMLGDNLLYGHGLPELLINAKNKVKNENKSVVFGFNVANPEKYGIATVENKKVLKIEEKPKKPESNWCVIGLYMYTNDIVNIAKSIKPSERGELEITDVNNKYIQHNKLDIGLFGRGYTWFDTGNVEDLFSASTFVRTIEKRQGLKIACLEEIAYYMGFISRKKLIELVAAIGNKTEYSEYLDKLIKSEVSSMNRLRCTNKK